MCGVSIQNIWKSVLSGCWPPVAVVDRPFAPSFWILTHGPQPQNFATGIFPKDCIHFLWTRRTRLTLVAAARYKSSLLASLYSLYLRHSTLPHASRTVPHPSLLNLRQPVHVGGIKKVATTNRKSTTSHKWLSRASATFVDCGFLWRHLWLGSVARVGSP
jgi:hypothetical protein